MIKSEICIYWKNNTCRFMANPEKCSFSHGMEDFQKNTIDCKYGSRCNNPKCNFFHGKGPTTVNMVYDLQIITKNKIKKNNKKNKKVYHEHINIIKNDNNNTFNNYSNNLIKMLPIIDTTNTEKVTIIKKNQDIKENIFIENKDYNKLLSYVDTYYIIHYTNIINRKNKYFGKIVEKNYNYINILRNDINELKNDNKKLKNKLKEQKLFHEKEILKIKNSYTTNKMVEHKNKDINKNKLINLYNKYINLYNIFKVNKYKDINKKEIEKYTNDKNIYKIKQRAYKVNSFYNKLKEGIYKDYLPISKIIKMTF